MVSEAAFHCMKVKCQGLWIETLLGSNPISAAGGPCNFGANYSNSLSLGSFICD